ncbi:MAG: ABC transporter ATP-binding protein [Saprospiraceae bacterium]|nr:ABC transporter ATP-binding protein [Saprospiraceae bacterium]
MKAAIEIKALSKAYRLAHQGVTATNLREHLFRLFSNRQSEEVFWALKEINLTINSGEVVGILGKNGAGKSTLLKILGRITRPTTGSATVRGKLVGMLEVGAGFHPELSGRENIWLNAAILGMKRQEIRAKFDSIIRSAGVEKFLDTPLKQFSDGMQLRLAFAISTHLNPDILLLDEVLAVGDIDFQRNCMATVEQAAKQGKTIIFVSHNLEAMQAICQRGIVLHDSKIVQDGPINQAVNFYQQLCSNAGTYVAL